MQSLLKFCDCADFYHLKTVLKNVAKNNLKLPSKTGKKGLFENGKKCRPKQQFFIVQKRQKCRPKQQFFIV
jgi:hypothetical protein